MKGKWGKKRKKLEKKKENLEKLEKKTDKNRKIFQDQIRKNHNRENRSSKIRERIGENGKLGRK